MKRNLPIITSFAYLSLCSGQLALADQQCPAESAAKLVSLQGSAAVMRGQQPDWQVAKLDDLLCEGSLVKLAANSRASLLLPDGIMLRLDENTVLTLKGIKARQTTMLDMVKGFVHFISRTPRHFEITTPFSNGGPEGTEFAMQVDDNKTDLWVYEGKVKFYNNYGALTLNPQESAEAVAGQAPRAQLNVKPDDAVSWALYYPNILPTPTTSQVVAPALQAAISAFRHGHADQGISALATDNTLAHDDYFYKVRAAMLLSVGQVKLALQELQAVKQAQDAEVLALQAVAALSQNQKSTAYTLAQQAVAANPHSAAAYSALSYAEQARFELSNALMAAEQAVQNAPQDAMVLARKAELELSLGHLDNSMIAAKQALALDAGLERTQTVMGFAELLHANTPAAMQSFSAAIALDSSSPLARLGLGLTKIRAGELAAGRQEIEIALGLDPGNALIRSYLGKAYYEEKRSPEALTQFELAKQLDANDPTAYFYDAIEKLTTNRPVEALQDIDQAIALNDNRGVYRSSLALDKDNAARSAAQGRIYNELGYQQLGLLEGWKSLNADNDNYSAHRLLADNYSALPRHEVARVSELLQSQLQQPVNITPIQPNLEETNLFVLNGLGPSNLSFNEFNPLFEYNRLSLQASGIYGSNNTIGDNTQLSGVHNNLSFSLGQFNYGTDGFRPNNFYKQNAYNAFLQDRVTDKLNLQFEYRHAVTTSGDLALNFDRNNFDNSLSQKKTTDSYRVGGRYEFNPRSALIASGIYQAITSDRNQYDPNTTQLVNDAYGTAYNVFHQNDFKYQGFTTELQHSYNGTNFSTLTGFGRIDQRVVWSDSTRLFPSDALALSIQNDNNLVTAPGIYGLGRTNFYNYTKFFLTNNLTATLGGSMDILNYIKTQIKPLNPKLGIVWQPTATTTVRAAIFRALSVNHFENLTIEPTQVAGFNQFYDDNFATSSWRYGLGIDHKFSEQILSGFEYSHRNIYMTNNGAYRAEHVGRLYFNYIPNKIIALGLEYFYEKIAQTGLGTSFDNAYTWGLFNQVETHRVPLTISLFSTTGLSLKFKNAFVHQSGIFQDPNLNVTYKGVSDFVVSDLSLSYRLPARHGMLSFGVNNLFNQNFNFQNTDYNNVLISPTRVLFSQLTLAF